MLRALLEHGIKPDLVIGTSVGAMNATFLAFEPTAAGVARLAALWHNIDDDDLFPGARFKTSWARMLMRGNRIFDNSGLRRTIESRLGRPRFEEARIPLGVVATELETGVETLFTSGDLIDPLLASAAMPGIYPPVQIGDRSYIDGGVANAVPIAPAVSMGASKVYVLNCSGNHQHRRPLVRPMDYLLHAFMLSRAGRLEIERPLMAQKAELIELPAPELGFTVPFTSMAFTPQLMTAGYETTMRFLEVPRAAIQARSVVTPSQPVAAGD
jgi:NTE family protein